MSYELVPDESVEGELLDADQPCDFCGGIDDVELRVDPYMAEVYDEHVTGWICSDCFDSRSDDI